MNASRIIPPGTYEVEKLPFVQAWTVRDGRGGLWVVAEDPDGRLVGVPWACHAVRIAEQMADEPERRDN